MRTLKANRDFGKPPHLFELIDKDGKSHGTFPDIGTLASVAKMYWPDQEQDPERSGRGWDVQVVRAGR